MKISVGRSRKDTKWKVESIEWEDLCERLATPVRTTETVREYKEMGADDKSSRKDVGGFVGGVVENGRRTKPNIKSRTLVTLDADFAKEGEWEDALALFDEAVCVYSTHSHTPQRPRLRYVIPLDRPVTVEEYEPIARQVAGDLGIEQFDVTTYETSRLFYWPSVPRDGAYVFRKQNGPRLCADEVLARYNDWRDAAEWPLASSERSIRSKQAKAQGDPTGKPGLVGQFCRTYDIPSAIETFLPDVYERCVDENRYTYTEGTTSSGVVLYQNGQFAYSHHATDPAGGALCNAFDLVRLHKFSALDYDTDRDVAITKRPSYKAMCDFARADPAVKQTIVSEAIENARSAFSYQVMAACGGAEDEANDGEINLDWVKDLEMNDHGEIKPTTNNLVLILNSDPVLSGKMAINEFIGAPCVVGDLPWHRCKDRQNGDRFDDDDLNALIHYIETTYNVYNVAKLRSALSVVLREKSFHPIRDYLNALSWDGTERAEHLFIDYLGAEDSLYTRTVTRKWLAAAVARVMRPGVKFDNLVVLVGEQGIGKSYLGRLLGMGWFSDTFTTVQGKDAYDQLKGCWIIEVAELSAMRRAEVESVKMFISKSEDTYRAAYREYSAVNKRQCVFYGTTNDDEFLHDSTGNRRFWPIGVDRDMAKSSVFSLTGDDIDQVWAEATAWYKNGEELFLDAEATEQAVIRQKQYSERDPRSGYVEEYLDMLLPENWEELSKEQRRDFIQGYNFSDATEGTVRRSEVSVVELAYELFGVGFSYSWQAREYADMMRGMKGWRKTGIRRRSSAYGQQRVYERIDDNGEKGESDEHDER